LIWDRRAPARQSARSAELGGVMTPNRDKLEVEFDEAMMDIYRRAKTEAKYVPSDFHNMLVQKRGVATARQFINDKKESSGFMKLVVLGFIQLTVEAVILDNPRWHSLFTAEEIEKVIARLRKYKYPPAMKAPLK
jgi:hypothetical protein